MNKKNLLCTICFFSLGFLSPELDSQSLMDEVDALQDFPEDDLYSSDSVQETLPTEENIQGDVSLDSLPIDSTANDLAGGAEQNALDDLPLESGMGDLPPPSEMPAYADSSLDSLPTSDSTSSNVPSPQQAMTGVVDESTAQLLDFNFFQMKDRMRLTLETDRPADFQREVRTERRQILVELSNTWIKKKNLQRALDTGEFDGPVAMIQAFNSKTGLLPSTKVLFQLRKFMDPTITRRGKKIYIDFPISVNKNELFRSELAQRAQKETFLSLDNVQSFKGKRINFRAKEAPVTDVLNFLSTVSGKNFVLADGGEKRVSLNVKNTPWDQVLAIVLLNAELGYQKVGNTYRVMPLSKLRKEISDAAKAVDEEQKLQSKVTQLFALSYAKASELLPAVQKFIKENNGESAVTDARTNSLLVSATPQNIAKVKKYVETVDRQTPQVHIEARIVEATKNFTRNYGFNWKLGLGRSLGNGFVNVGLVDSGGEGTSTGDNASELIASGNSAGPFTFGSNGDFGFVQALLNLGEKEADTKIVASPSVTVADNKTATLVQGAEFTFLVPATGGNEESNVQTVDANLSLEVTPQVTNDQNVLLNIKLKRDSIGEALTSGADSTVPVNKREINTELLVASGRTVVIGGLYIKDKGKTSVGWPLLRNIPLLGHLFNSENSKFESESELVMFIAPKILNPDKAFSFSTSQQI